MRREGACGKVMSQASKGVIMADRRQLMLSQAGGRLGLSLFCASHETITVGSGID